MRGIIREILDDADAPLHYKKITELAARKSLGKKLNARIISRTAHGIALLFKPGTYGLAKHIPISDNQMHHICALSENIMLENQTKTQWHTAEILSRLPPQLTRSYKGLDQYLLSIILAKSEILINHGMNVWTAAGQQNSAIKRIDRKQTTQNIIKIITQAGQPLSTHEIKERLATMQVVNINFVIPLSPPLVRIKRGLWGINSRDVPISRGRQRMLIDKLVDKLNERQFGIRLCEITDLLEVDADLSHILYSMAVQDKRIKAISRNYLYLSEWKDARFAKL